MRVRLQKLMAQAGIASRRASEELIRQGRVQVNGEVITEMGVQVDPDRDRVTVNGRPVRVPTEKRYIMLYKPAGYLSVMVDDRGRRALGNLVPAGEGLHPVGRLDLDSEGLILLTNDGETTLRLTHPRYGHEKEYLAKVDGTPTERALRSLRQGVKLEDGPTAEANVFRVRESPWGPAEAGRSWLGLVIHEGRKRQIRRMCAAVGNPVRRLIRIRSGPILLGDLQPGQWRALTPEETTRLLESVRRQQVRR